MALGTLSLLIEPGVITFCYDGAQVGQQTTGVTGAPMYLADCESLIISILDKLTSGLLYLDKDKYV